MDDKAACHQLNNFDPNLCPDSVAFMRMSKWDRRYLVLAKHIAEWSKDPSTKVGAVIVNRDNQIVGTGYNGFPRGVKDDAERYNDRPVKYKFVVHAELNAVLLAGDRCKGSTIYVWPQFVEGVPPTCNECAKAIIQAGIKRVVGQKGSGLNRGSWSESAIVAKKMYREAGVELALV